jgi:hypothetical protein
VRIALGLGGKASVDLAGRPGEFGELMTKRLQISGRFYGRLDDRIAPGMKVQGTKVDRSGYAGFRTKVRWNIFSFPPLFLLQHPVRQALTVKCGMANLV